MKSHIPMTAPLGELVVAVFDKAARYSSDPREVSRLATQAIMELLRRLRRFSMALPARSQPAKASALS
jgi:hypothetical protein